MATTHEHPNAPPHDNAEFANLEAEQGIIGALLSNNAALNHINRSGLRSEHFSDQLHRRIFDACVAMIGEGKVTNPVTLKAKFAEIEISYLAKLLGASANIVSVHDYACSIVEFAMKRRLIEAARQVIGSKESSADMATTLGKTINEITTASYAPTMRSAKAVTQEIIEDMATDVIPTSTGIISLDECMDGGMYAGKAYGFAARKKIGKTILACTVSHNMNKAGVPHLFICGEMSAKEVHQRVLCRELDMYSNAFRTKFAEAHHVQVKLAEYHSKMPANAIYMDAPGITFQQLKQAVSNAYTNHGIKGFILDYWQLVGGKESKDSEAYHLGMVAQWIAEVCRRLNIWAFVAAQINQEGNTRGGEGLRLAFDQVYQIHAPNDDPSLDMRWVEMMDTRYTKWRNIGTKDLGGWSLNQKGLFFEDADF